MIVQLKDLPQNILGFEFIGEVSSKDYESVIYPVLKKIKSGKRKIRILCQFDTDFKKFDLGAIWDDTVMSIKHFLDWEKVAIISDSDLMNHTFKALGFLMPGHLRTFHINEKEKALYWLEDNEDVNEYQEEKEK